MPTYSGPQYGAVPTFPSPGAPVGAYDQSFGVAPPGGTFGGFLPRFSDIGGTQPAGNEDFLGTYRRPEYNTANVRTKRPGGTGFIGQLAADSDSNLLNAQERSRARRTAALLDAIQAETFRDAQRQSNLFQLNLQGQDARIPDLLNRNLGLGQNVLDTYFGNLGELADDTDVRRDRVQIGQQGIEQDYRDRIPGLMALTSQRGREAASDIDRAAGRQHGSNISNLVSGGLYNTTVADKQRRDTEEQRSRAHRELADQVLGQNLGLQEQLTGDALQAQERGVGLRGRYDQPLLQQLSQGVSQAGQIGEAQRATDTALASDLTSSRLGFLGDEMNRLQAPTLTELINMAVQGPSAQPYPIGTAPRQQSSLIGRI